MVSGVRTPPGVHQHNRFRQHGPACSPVPCPGVQSVEYLQGWTAHYRRKKGTLYNLGKSLLLSKPPFSHLPNGRNRVWSAYCLVATSLVSSWLGACLCRHRSIQTLEVLKIHLGNILVPSFPRTLAEASQAWGPWREADALMTGAPLEVRPWARLPSGSLGRLHPPQHPHLSGLSHRLCTAPLPTTAQCQETWRLQVQNE